MSAGIAADVVLHDNYNPKNYDFVRTVGTGAAGSLSTPGSKVVVLSPFPYGITTSRHIMITDGVTRETAIPTAVSGVWGSPSGTITVTTVNSYVGAWSVRSATGGIQEAIETIAAPTYPVTGPGTTIIISTSLTLYAPVHVHVEGVRIIGTTANWVIPLIESPFGVGFNVVAGSVEVAHLSIKGGANPLTGAPAPVGNIGIVTTGVRGHIHDLVITQVYGGIEIAGGFHTAVKNIWGRNCSGYLIKHSGGVSPFLDTITYGGDLPFEVAAEAGIVVNASGCYIYNTDILVARHGILIEPVNAPVEWTFVYDARIDQCWHAGVMIRNNTVHLLKGIFIHDLWSASNGVGFAESFTSNGLPLGTEDGIGLMIGEDTDIGGGINGITVSGGEIHNNRYQNVKIFRGTNFKLFNLLFLETNLGGGTANTIDNVYLATSERVEIAECEFRGAAGGQPALRSAICGAGPGTVVVRNNNFAGTYATSPIFDFGSFVIIDGLNRGMDDAPVVVASSATMTLGPRRLFQVTGTTTVSTILPVYEGRIIVLQKIDAGALIMDTAGNLQSHTGAPGTILTVNNGENVLCHFTGSKWIIQK